MGRDVNLVFSGRYFVHMDGKGVLENENASVAIAGDTIVEIGPDLAAKYPQAENIAEPHG